MKALKPLPMSGREVLPLVEGGKGIAVSNGESSGAWAAAGGIGTFSGVNADSYDENGNLLPQIYNGKTRRERHNELIAFGIEGELRDKRFLHIPLVHAKRFVLSDLGIYARAGRSLPVAADVLLRLLAEELAARAEADPAYKR